VAKPKQRKSGRICSAGKQFFPSASCARKKRLQGRCWR